MPAGTDLITWNPRAGDEGDDRYRWPDDVPLYAGTTPAGFQDPLNPTIDEINSAEGLNQIVAEIRRRTPAIDEQANPYGFLAIHPMPFFEDKFQEIPVGSRVPWWTQAPGISGASGYSNMDPRVLARDHVYYNAEARTGSLSTYGNAFKSGELTYRPTPPGNGFNMVIAGTSQYLDTGYTGSMPFPSLNTYQPITQDIILFIRKRLAAEKILKTPLCKYTMRSQMAYGQSNLQLITGIKCISDVYPPYTGGPSFYTGRKEHDPPSGWSNPIYVVGQGTYCNACSATDWTYYQPYEAGSEISVVHASTDNVAPPLFGNKVIDGVTTAPGQYVLLIGQSDPTQNGTYQTKAGDWTPVPTDLYGLTFNVSQGSSYGGKAIVITKGYTNNAVTDPILYEVLDGPYRFKTNRLLFNVRVPDENISGGYMKFTYRVRSIHAICQVWTPIVLCDLGFYIEELSEIDQTNPMLSLEPFWGLGTLIGRYDMSATDTGRAGYWTTASLEIFGPVTPGLRTYAITTLADYEGIQPLLPSTTGYRSFENYVIDGYDLGTTYSPIELYFYTA